MILKEISAIEHATVSLPEGSRIRKEWMENERCQVWPMKLVYTVKPPQVNDAPLMAEKFKRKARTVLCGNMAEANASEVYAGTAPREVARATLIRAAREGWRVGVLDITSAFLQTPLEAVAAPVVVASPPRILERQGLVEPKMLWRITHAVYDMACVKAQSYGGRSAI